MDNRPIEIMEEGEGVPFRLALNNSALLDDSLQGITSDAPVPIDVDDHDVPCADSNGNCSHLAERYVSRILHLAFLAPDITDTILNGRQPGDLELDRLMKGISLDWAGQRRAFGFKVRR